MLKNRTTIDLCSIARAGGGIDIEVGTRTLDDLCSIARAASESGSRLYLRGLGNRTTPDLCSIARAGKGAVVFADSPPGPQQY